MAVSLSVAKTYWRTSPPDPAYVADLLGASALGPHVVVKFTIKNLGRTVARVADVWPFDNVLSVSDAMGNPVRCGDAPRPLYRDLRKAPDGQGVVGGANLNPYWEATMDGAYHIIEPGKSRDMSTVGVEMTCFGLVAGETYTVWGVAATWGHWEPDGAPLRPTLISNTIRVTVPSGP